jgi:hypothetical protein
VLGKGRDSIRRRLDRDEVRADVAGGDELVAVDVAPHDAAQAPPVELGGQRPVLDERVDRGGTTAQVDDPGQVGGPELDHATPGAQQGGTSMFSVDGRGQGTSRARTRHGWNAAVSLPPPRPLRWG